MKDLLLRLAPITCIAALVGCGARVVVDEAGEGGATSSAAPEGGEAACSARTFLGDPDGGSFAVADDRYGYWSGKQGGIYRVDLETSEVLELAQFDLSLGAITVADGFVYGGALSSLFRVPIGGGPTEPLTQTVSDRLIAIRVVGDDVVALTRTGVLYEVHLPTREVRSSALSLLGVAEAREMAADANHAYVLAALVKAPNATRLMKVSRADFSIEPLGSVVNPTSLQRVESGLLLGSYDVDAKVETLSLVTPADGATTSLFSFGADSPAALFADESGVFAAYAEQQPTTHLGATARWFSWDGAHSAPVGEARWIGPRGDQDFRWSGILNLAVAGRWVLAIVDPADSWPDPNVGALAFCTPSEAR